MKKLTKFLIPTVGLLTATLPFLSAGCGDTNKNWDKEITLKNYWTNEGFIGTDKEKAFINKLNADFKALKDADPKLKNLPDVTFKIATGVDYGTLLSDLKTDKKDSDIGFLPYHSFANSLLNKNLDGNNLKANFAPKLIGQTATLKFIWSGDDNNHYTTGDANDKLRVAANDENVEQFQAFGEFPSWTDDNASLAFDGSKYKAFYKNNELTYVYHGAIYIAGTKAQRDAIIAAWDSKNWDAFKAYGIIFKKPSSGGSYKYQTALLAKHFGKNLDELRASLEKENNTLVTKGKSAASNLGKGTDSTRRNIGFSDEGEFNWTPKSWGEDIYKPSGYNPNEANNFNSETNDVVRVFTLTNPAPYDVILGRAGLDEDQARLIKTVLNDLSLSENTFGIYTGYNKFERITANEFKNFVKLQLAAEGIINFEESFVPTGAPSVGPTPEPATN